MLGCWDKPRPPPLPPVHKCRRDGAWFRWKLPWIHSCSTLSYIWVPLMKLKIFFMKLSRKIVSLRQKQRYLTVWRDENTCNLVFDRKDMRQWQFSSCPERMAELGKSKGTCKYGEITKHRCFQEKMSVAMNLALHIKDIWNIKIFNYQAKAKVHASIGR